jgi:ATP-dependent Clp protease ATP-binding subunit ClpA
MKDPHSPSLMLIWQVAEIEARNLKATAIEPRHLFLGLCKTVDLDLPAILAKDTKERDEVLEELLREVRRLRSVFRAAGLDAKTFRRRLRQPAQDRRFALTTLERLHRSDAARKVFASAEHLATLAGSPVFPVHLLYAVILAKDADRDEVFRELGIGKARLLEAAKRDVLFRRDGSVFSLGKGRTQSN